MRKKTKIVATLGPASESPAIIAAMIAAGANVFRINLSHTDADLFRTLVGRVRAAAEAAGQPVGVMADLRGPRIRIGEVENDRVELPKDGVVVLTPEPVIGTPGRLAISYPDLAGDLTVGSEILLDDGNVRLEVEEMRGRDIVCRIRRGGPVSSNRGINLPHRDVGLPALTEKDLEDAALGIELGVDLFALSFVQRADDVARLNAFIAERGGHQKVIAKIERSNALANIESIAAESFGVMVARGDLALEVSIEETPIAQKQIMDVCRAVRRPVITATQMLESMIKASKPTRAEAADIANAILDGTDALMLSGETAIGVDPVNVVETMARIAHRIEAAVGEGRLRPPAEPPRLSTSLAVLADAAKTVAADMGASAILLYTDTGESAVHAAVERPRTPILALCVSEVVRRRIAVVWGLETRLIDLDEAAGQVLEVARREAAASGLVKSGDTMVLIVGHVFPDPDVSTILKIDRVP